MSRLWWQLPGPSRFVARIVQDLRDGKNVVLCLPEHVPDGLASAIRSALGDSEEWSWYTLRVREEDGAADPVRLLFSRFVPHARPDALWNAGALVTEEALAGKLLWLDGFTPPVWPAWKAFLEDYEHACRARSVFERTLFCIPLIGTLALDPPGEDVCLAHHSWRGCVDLLDMLVFTATLLQGKQIPDLQKRVIVSIIAHLALWDPTVSEYLARESRDKIFNPIPLLQGIAKERGWHGENEALLAAPWHAGMLDVVDRVERVHSAVLAAHGADSTIQRRIWSAEVGVMLPFVEERRQDILTRFAGVLCVPFTTRFGEVITNVRDLEIGHIERQLADNPAVSAEMRQLIKQLRKIRNDLSHLEPLDPELLLSGEVLRASHGEDLRNNWEFSELARYRTKGKR